MPSRRLCPRTRLDAHLSALVCAHLLAQDPVPVINALREAARGHEDVLADVAADCAGWYRATESAAMCDALEMLAADLRD